MFRDSAKLLDAVPLDGHNYRRSSFTDSFYLGTPRPEKSALAQWQVRLVFF
jgi:hypothetical protein